MFEAFIVDSSFASVTGTGFCGACLPDGTNRDGSIESLY
jgi:hypothetical protein